MSPQQKENVTVTWRVIALVLLGYVGYELREIKTEIRQSSDFRIEQKGLNREFETSLKDVKSNTHEMRTEIKELKTYYWEAVGRNRR